MPVMMIYNVNGPVAVILFMFMPVIRDGVDDPLEDHALVTQQLDQVCPSV